MHALPCEQVGVLGKAGRCYTYGIIRFQPLKQATPVSLQAFLWRPWPRCKTEASSMHIVRLWAPSGGILCAPSSSQCTFPSWKSSRCGEIVWVFICLLDLDLLEVFWLDLSFWSLARGEMIGFVLDLFERQPKSWDEDFLSPQIIFKDLSAWEGEVWVGIEHLLDCERYKKGTLGFGPILKYLGPSERKFGSLRPHTLQPPSSYCKNSHMNPTGEYCSVRKGTLTDTCYNREELWHILLSGRSQNQKTTSCMMTFMWTV